MRFILRCLAAAALALGLASPSAAEWREAKTRHFTIYSEQRADVLRDYASRLERFDQAVRLARDLDDPKLTDSNRLTVYVLRNQGEVAAMIGSRSSGVAGFYMARASGPVAFVHADRSTRESILDAETVFFHEYMHHLMLQDLRVALPAWMVEGYAEFFGTAEILDDGSVRIGAAPKHRAFGLFELQTLGMSTEEMVGATDEKLDGADMETIYGRGWLLTHYLTFEPSRRGQVTRYVMGIQRGETPLASARAAFGDLRQLDRELDRYLERRTIMSKVVPAEQLTVGDIVIRELSEPESAIIDVAMRSHRGVDKKSAPGVAADARRVAERFPNDPFVQAALSEAEHDVENYSAAVAAADRALAANPNSSKALIYKGRALMEMGKKDPAKADWAAVRSWLARANKLDPEDAEPLMLYYQTYVAEGARPPKLAVDGLLYAHILVPQDDELRLLAVRQLIGDGRMAEARSAFAPIAYDPHSGESRQKLLAIMSALTAGSSSQAITLLDELKREAEKD